MQRVPRAAPSAALGGPVAPGIGARQAARQRPGARPAVRWRHVGGAPVKVPRHGLPEERAVAALHRSEEHTAELQSLMRISYAVFCLKKKTTFTSNTQHTQINLIYYQKYYTTLMES